MNRGSIPNSRGEKNVRTLAALPTGGSAFCGALEEGMGDVFVSVTQTNKQTSFQLKPGEKEAAEGEEQLETSGGGTATSVKASKWPPEKIRQ